MGQVSGNPAARQAAMDGGGAGRAASAQRPGGGRAQRLAALAVSIAGLALAAACGATAPQAPAAPPTASTPASTPAPTPAAAPSRAADAPAPPSPAAAPPEGLAYLWQSVAGHLALLRAARPIADWLSDPATPEATRQRLARAQQMRRFAVEQLALPDNASYSRYVELGREAVVWNVVAAPADALRLKTWCFPLMGCVGYRGYFDRAHAQALAQQLAAEGWETLVYAVPAYSTLGWTNWLGGDPLLSTMLASPEPELARLLFHELAHQKLYVADDTAFNESYATAVERLGGARWLALLPLEAQRAFAEREQRRLAFRALTRQTRQELEDIYASPPDRTVSGATEKESILARKAEVMARFRARYAELKAGWGGASGYDAWVAQANNAAFALQAAYDQWVPAFEALFVAQGCKFAAFHHAAAALARKPLSERRVALEQLSTPTAGGAVGASCASPTAAYISTP